MSKTNLPLLSDVQFLPPYTNEEKFEEFIIDLFNGIDGTKSYYRYGRKGQNQCGLDIYSTCKKTIIQCKLKKINRRDTIILKELISDIETDYLRINKFLVDNPDKFNRVIFASTYKNDTSIENLCIKMSSPNLTVEYWSWERIVKNIPNEVLKSNFADLISHLRNYYNKPNSNIEKNNVFFIKKTLPILDQIYEYLTLIYREINFIPPFILKSNFPIKNDSDYYTDYSVFTLSTNNKKLFDFFKSIEIHKGNSVKFIDKQLIKKVDNYESKTKYILEKLTNNLVFKLSLAKSQEVVSVLYLVNKINNKLSFNYDRLKFVDLFSLINKRENNTNKLIKLAYINYQLGNFISSANLFLTISKKAKLNKNKTIYFIAQFNLLKLAKFIRYRYWQNYEAEKLYRKLNQIDIEKVYEFSLTEKNEKLISWIKNNDFFNEAHENIHQIVNEIRDHYYSQLNGGWSRNNNVSKLINEYANLYCFLSENFIIYNTFSEYESLTTTFIEGIFASHAIAGENNTKLLRIDDWILHKILLYGKSSEIKKLFYRYNLKHLEYEYAKDKRDNIFEIINNFLDGDIAIKNAFDNCCEGNNLFFWDKYNEIYDNIIILIGILNIPAKKTNEIIAKLYDFIKNTSNINKFRIKNVDYLLTRKHSIIELSLLTKFLFLSVEDSRFRDINFTEKIVNILETRKDSIKIPKSIKCMLENISFELSSNKIQSISPLMLVHISRITNDKSYKKVLSDKIFSLLKETFNIKLYFQATIYDTINFNKILFNMYFNLVKDNKSNSNIFNFKNKNTTLLDFFNLCFKFKLNINEERFQCFKNIDVYFDWLIDPLNFNYKSFNPEWICENPTKYYFEYLRKFSIIKQEVQKFLKENPNGQIEKAYFHIYNEI